MSQFINPNKLGQHLRELEAENARLREELTEEIRISNLRGEAIENHLAELSAQSYDLGDLREQLSAAQAEVAVLQEYKHMYESCSK